MWSLEFRNGLNQEPGLEKGLCYLRFGVYLVEALPGHAYWMVGVFGVASG